jgi:YidC/Oxa1 family membrane protein insertase
MDRNSAIGLTLIAALLLAYFYWFAPTSQPQVQKPVSEVVTQHALKDSARQQAPALTDSVLVASYGDLSTFVRGNESNIKVETEDLNIILSNKGGII